jgi:hypothetical protein
MVWTRKDVALPFEKFRYLKVTGLSGNYASSPRRVAATNELFFGSPMSKDKIPHIYVLKNFNDSAFPDY